MALAKGEDFSWVVDFVLIFPFPDQQILRKDIFQLGRANVITDGLLWLRVSQAFKAEEAP